MNKYDFTGLDIKPDMVGVHSINPFLGSNSSSRQVMLGNHIGQAISLIDGEERLILTGTETALGRHVADIRVPARCIIYTVITRYKSSYQNPSIYNKELYVIYEEIDTGMFGVLQIPTYGSFHSLFGYRLEYVEDIESLLKPREILEKDMVLARPRTIRENGGYCFGTNLNVAYMSLRDVSEDGFIVSESALKKLRFDIFERRSVQIGRKDIPLNIYGDKKNYKSFPDIGMAVREDGVLIAKRKFDPVYTISKMDWKGLSKIDFVNDTVYCIKNGEVVDIDIHWNKNKQYHVFNIVRDQFEHYAKLKDQFYREVLRVYKDLKQRKGRTGLKLRPELSCLIQDALLTVGKEEGFRFVPERVKKVFKLEPIDEFKIDFVVRSTVTPTIGFKLTDLHGGKGVIVKILKDHEMPVDSEGNRADIIIDPNSVVSRMNLGRLYEQYYSGAIVKTKKQIEVMVKSSGDDNSYRTAYRYLLGFLKIVSPVMYEEYKQYETSIDIVKDIVNDIVTGQLQVFIPVDGSIRHDNVVKMLEESEYRPPLGPVTMVIDGKTIQTKEKIRIAPQYFLLLEKIANQWMAVSTVHLNHFNVPTSVPKPIRDRMVYRESAVKFIGEMETRVLASYTDPAVMAELMDRNASVRTHIEIYRRLLMDDYPTDIDTIVDRDKIPLYSTSHREAGTAPMQLVYHIANCAGFRFNFVKDDK